MEGVATDRQIPGHEEYRAAFQLFDRNNDDYAYTWIDEVFAGYVRGRISFEELEQAIRSLGRNPQQQEIRDMITEFDADGNGTIEYEEFYNFMTREMEESEAEEALRAAFNAMDSDGDGFITESELRQVMINLHAGLGDGEVEQMIRNADSNGDRKISYPEFQGINKQHFS